MKNILLIFAAVLMTGCATVKQASDVDVSYKAFAKANSREAVFSRHKSFMAVTVVPKDDKDGLKAYGSSINTFYSEPDYAYSSYEFEGMEDSRLFEEDLLTCSDAYWHVINKDKSEQMFVEWPAMSDAEKRNNLADIGTFLDGSEFGEKMTGFKNNGDGTVTIITNAPADKTVDVRALPEAWKGATMEYSYIADTKTLELLSFSSRILTDKGSIDYISETISYDVEAPKESVSLRDTVKKIEAEEPKNPRTITVIYDPGTDKAETFKKTAGSSVLVSPVYRDGYKPYKDPEGKTPFTGSDGKSDITIYLLKK